MCEGFNMTIEQREQNPDVNSYNPDGGQTEDRSPTDGANKNPDNVERDRQDDVVPVPPDVSPTVPIEEPPGEDGPPVGDVDDSPKQIA
jgi:hypothetical protein